MTNHIRYVRNFWGIGLVLLLAAGGLPGAAAHEGHDHEAILLKLEAPSVNQTVSGVANLRGWALAKAGIQQITLMIDGTVVSTIPFGGIREDVAAAYPGDDYPNAGTSGFSMALNYGLLSPGPHQIVVTAFDTNGLTQAATANITVIGFHKAFFPAGTEIDFSHATVSGAGQTITIQGLHVDHEHYDVKLTWQTEAQAFQFTEIIAQ